MRDHIAAARSVAQHEHSNILGAASPDHDDRVWPHLTPLCRHQLRLLCRHHRQLLHRQRQAMRRGLRRPVENRLDVAFGWITRKNTYIQPFLGIKPLLFGRVIAGKLELVEPLELN